MRNYDTWGPRLRRALICSWRGHDWSLKLSGSLCRRCNLFEVRR